MKTLLTSIRALIVFTLLAGVLYPLAVTLAAQAIFPREANGSRLPNGSAMLAQKFTSPQYFWPRPSAADFATVASGASNQGSTSAKLRDQIAERRAAWGEGAPSDLLTASGSGLDPHISPEAARFQISRVAAARSLPTETVAAMVQRHVEPPQFGVFGQARVNVLELNLALDRPQ